MTENVVLPIEFVDFMDKAIIEHEKFLIALIDAMAQGLADAWEEQGNGTCTKESMIKAYTGKVLEGK